MTEAIDQPRHQVLAPGLDVPRALGHSGVRCKADVGDLTIPDEDRLML
jgi:hypothetical protein